MGPRIEPGSEYCHTFEKTSKRTNIVVKKVGPKFGLQTALERTTCGNQKRKNGALQPQGQTGGNGNPGICFINVDLVLGFPTTYLWKSKYAALNVKIWLETKSHKTIPQAALERLHTHSVSVEVDAAQ